LRPKAFFELITLRNFSARKLVSLSCYIDSLSLPILLEFQANRTFPVQKYDKV
jgi:hypothetical protein